MRDYEIARARMVNGQLIRRGITDKRVLRAMGAVPRHLFVDQAFWPRAYGDHPLPIGSDQTISQPYIVALMTQALEVGAGERILEIGTGSGYQTAVLALLAETVYTVERHRELTKSAKRVLHKLAIENVRFKVADGSMGWKEEAPFDGIIVTAGSPDIPESLLVQLGNGGRLVIPVGSKHTQRLMHIVKGEKVLEKNDICGCMFVPLVGSQGWRTE